MNERSKSYENHRGRTSIARWSRPLWLCNNRFPTWQLHSRTNTTSGKLCNRCKNSSPFLADAENETLAVHQSLPLLALLGTATHFRARRFCHLHLRNLNKTSSLIVGSILSAMAVKPNAAIAKLVYRLTAIPCTS